MFETADLPSSRAYPVTAAGAVLLVDDEPDIVDVMAAWTEADGCQVLRAASARAALDVASTHPIAVAVCDVQMPEHDGFWLVEHLRARHPSIAVVLVTGIADVEWALRGLQVGAVDYLLKPFDQRTFSRALETALRQHRIRADAETLRDARAVELAARHQRLTDALGRLGICTTAHVRAALDLVACRQDQWREHSLRVAALSRRLATALQMTGEQVEHLEQGALLHEVGRLVLPDTLLTRTGELSAEDRALWRRVPTLAASVLDAVPSLTGPASIIRARFEEYAGGGYPRQLTAEQIPLGSRVLAVTDSYDAMRSPRPFRDAFTHDQAAAELTRGAGTQFDPDVVRRFLRLPHIG
jgi:response regulator RpfG family c-di-GMP phosphodiesterase